jgi:hypothetical protein
MRRVPAIKREPQADRACDDVLSARGQVVGVYRPGFEEDSTLRSTFIRELTLLQLSRAPVMSGPDQLVQPAIPKTVVRYWHDSEDVPDDVESCLETWDPLREEGFAFRQFDDVTAAAYIAERYDTREVAAFARCRHPAMRSDYLRMCVLLADGGFYVDADDVLRGDGWRDLFCDSALKVQPLCYDLSTNAMVPSAELSRVDLPTDDRIFYVNNDPIVAPAGHPILRRALVRATDRLLGEDPAPEIQSTTGPGNLTAALTAHVISQWEGTHAAPDFMFLLDWERIAEPRWELEYRNDDRNWRNMNAAGGVEDAD